jgi:hypothetical protein
MRVLAVSLIVLLAGCSLQSAQLEQVSRWVGSGQKIAPEARAYAWRLTFNGTEYTVYPVRVEAGYLFANAAGLEVLFDGRDILSVSGLPGAIGDISMRRYAGDVRWIERGGSGQSGITELKCRPTESQPAMWRTHCTATIDGVAFPMHSEGRLGADGRLAYVRTQLIPGAGPLVLRLANPAGRR